MEEIEMRSIKIASILRWSIFFVVLFATILIFFLHFFGGTSKDSEDIYTCPMHPTYTSNQMGECPICGMSLVPVNKLKKGDKEDTKHGSIKHHTSKESTGTDLLLYTCPMHPEILSDKEGRCPICNMRLVEKEGPSSIDRPSAHPVEDKGVNPNSTTRETLHIADNRLNLIGITYTEVIRRELEDYISAFGTIIYDDAKRVKLHIRTSGFIERIYKREGDFVNIGERIFSIYSPEIFQTEEEYVNLIIRGDISGQYEIIRSVEEKLRILNVPQQEIERLRGEKKVVEYIDMLSPSKGYITKKLVSEKEFITQSTPLFEIVDTSTIFLVLSIFERDLSNIKTKMEVVFMAESMPGMEFRGKVDIIYPSFKYGLRVGEVRVILRNPNNLLRTGMFGKAKFLSGKRDVLLLNRDAIVFGGENYYVFKVVDRGVFEKRVIKIGKRYDDYYEILTGLSEGDKVVLNGNFLIDSESSIQSAYEKRPLENHRH